MAPDLERLARTPWPIASLASFGIRLHRVLTNDIRNGERNSTLTSICGKLLHYGVTDLIILNDIMLCVNKARCEHPLDEDEVEDIVANVVKAHLKRSRGDG
jgi:hypothetical protein